ncbi:MAG TPA: hypothetical protein VFF89_05885 [Sphingobium sp.]|nr:hypothetical protein [Sphingobium sp.]
MPPLTARRLLLFPLALAAASASPAAAQEAAPLVGMWGAGDVLLALDKEGGRLQIGCLLARFAPVRPDAAGRFDVRAQVEPISALPPQSDEDEAPAPAAARLSGRAAGGTLDLVLERAGEAPRRLRLMLGQRGKQARCL